MHIYRDQTSSMRETQAEIAVRACFIIVPEKHCSEIVLPDCSGRCNCSIRLGALLHPWEGIYCGLIGPLVPPVCCQHGRAILCSAYTVKKGQRVSLPQPGCHNQTLPGNEQFNYSRPGKVWFRQVSDISAADGEIANLPFLQCGTRDGSPRLFWPV